MRILFVCHGNICRSTMAEFVMKDIVKKHGVSHNYYIDSAATSTEEIGNDTHYGTKQKLKQEQISYTPRKARQITKEDYTQFDYLIGMDEANIRNMKRMLPDDTQHKIYALLDFTQQSRSIADPWYTGNFDATYNDVHEGCLALFSYLEKEIRK